MIKVNLVPAEILDREVQRQRAIQVGIVAGLVALLFAGVSFTHYRTKIQVTKQLEEENARLKKLEAIVAQVNAFESKAAAVRSRLGVMNDLLKSRELYPKFMVDIIESFPDGVWIGTLSTTKKDKTLSLSMPAFAASTGDLTTWLRTLEESKIFSEAKISGIAIDQEGKHTFSMSMIYTPQDGEKKQP
ncbi:MAG: PilN domain-containing protein [Elusimicrobiota bacterium]